MGAFMVDGVVVCDIPSDEELNRNQINSLTGTTANTWQKGRGEKETGDNTWQGKKAELAFEQLIRQDKSVDYLTYDEFRSDDFKNHAPFDGLIFKKDIDRGALEALIDKVNDEVARSGRPGIISVDLRRELEDNRIATVEIKSSVLKETLGDYNGVSRSGLMTTKDYRRLIKNMRRWDFIVYPHYTRSGNHIKCFYEYAKFVRSHFSEFEGFGNERFLKELMRTEYDHACSVYTRLYFDFANDKILIPGYLLKEDFFKEPNIQKMHGEKSEEALYFMRGITCGTPFLEIGRDERIWNRDRAEVYKSLLAGEKKICQNCGRELNVCDSEMNKKYFYKCFQCGKTYCMEAKW